MNRELELTKKGIPKVVVIILNWNGKALTADCLDSLQKVTYPNFDGNSRGQCIHGRVIAVFQNSVPLGCCSGE